MFHRLAWSTAAAPSFAGGRRLRRPVPPVADAGTPVIWLPPRRLRTRPRTSQGSATRSTPSVPTTFASTIRPGRRPSPDVKTHLAVRLGRLVRGPAGTAPSSSSTRLHEHRAAVSPRRSSARCDGQLLGEPGDVGEPLGDDVGVQLVVVAGRLGAVLVGVAEDADGVEPRAGEEALQLGQVGLGLAGEAHDEVGARRRPAAPCRGWCRAVRGTGRCRRSGASRAARRARSAGRTGRSTGATFGVEVRTSMSPGRISAGCR